GPHPAAAVDPLPMRALQAQRTAGSRLPRARVSDGPPLPAVGRYASLAARAGPVHLTYRQAWRLIAQLRETASARGWALRAVAVTRDGVHTVVAVRNDPVPAVVIADLKGDGSRALSTARGGAPRRWWNEGGARTSLDDEAALSAAIRRVRDQPGALATWVDPHWPWR
ncbi:MAG: hypothetical protein O3B31_11620, partial [Chloroflexi bacterium]|nr:hypothetical protein [Chloroflexota bacterium]